MSWFEKIPPDERADVVLFIVLGVATVAGLALYFLHPALLRWLS